MDHMAGSAVQGTEMGTDDDDDGNDRGFLIPAGYRDLRIIETPNARHIASVIWGVTLVCAFFCLSKIVRQSLAAHRRHRLRNIYIYLIWVTWISTTVSSLVVWLWLLFFLPTRWVRPFLQRGNMTITPPGPWLTDTFVPTQFLDLSGHQYVRAWPGSRASRLAPPIPPFRTTLTSLFSGLLWLVHMQCILQIVANRLAFLLAHRGRRIRWIVFGVMTFLTVSGSCSYLPASIELNPRIMRFNSVWDRCIKVLFSTVDLSLNGLFLHLVYSKLVSAGLTKYWPLFWLNSSMVFVSISLDVSTAPPPCQFI